MNNPELYRKANACQRCDAQQIIKEYFPQLNWNGKDSLIDLGTGSGDVLMDFVHPSLPCNFQRLVGSDINPKMVDYAQREYGHHKNVEFRILDMATRENLPKDLRGQFDHVTSFYALMYASDLRQTLSNIWDLLRPDAGGDCLLLTLIHHHVYLSYKILAAMDKWSKYMYDMDSYIPPQIYWKNPKEKFENLMLGNGFAECHVDIQSKTFTYDNVEVFRSNMEAVSPFLPRIPQKLHSEFMDDLMYHSFQIIGINYNTMDRRAKCPIQHRVAVIYARKSGRRNKKQI